MLDQTSEKSDFITSPEVHQIFGELLGAWVMQEWIVAGSPPALEYLELGPGFGSLFQINAVFDGFDSKFSQITLIF